MVTPPLPAAAAAAAVPMALAVDCRLTVLSDHFYQGLTHCVQPCRMQQQQAPTLLTLQPQRLLQQLALLKVQQWDQQQQLAAARQ